MIDTELDTTTRWQLTAPESLVLRDGPHAKPAEVVKLALLELVARRALRLVEVETRGLFGRRGTEVVIGTGSQAAPADGPLGPVATLALDAKAHTYPDGTVGIGLRSFAMTCAARFGRPPRLYIDRWVLPALVERGLYTRIDRKVLGVVPQTSWALTGEGELARHRLQELTTTAEHEVDDWAERDPARLARFLATAGGAALLVPAAYPAFEAFATRLAAQPDDAAWMGALVATMMVPADSSPSGHPDVGGFDVSALSFDFSSIAGLDGAFGGFDAGFSDGGASSGGDGGGSSAT